MIDPPIDISRTRNRIGFVRDESSWIRILTLKAHQAPHPGPRRDADGSDLSVQGGILDQTKVLLPSSAGAMRRRRTHVRAHISAHKEHPTSTGI